jgi:hypothetical protein
MVTRTLTLEPTRASWVAITAAVLNAAAALVMLIWLRPGVPPGEEQLSERIAYVADNVGVWRASWFVWNLAAISLVAFYVVLMLRWRERAPVLCWGAVLLAAAGLAADTGAEALLMIVSPGADATTFALVEKIGLALTGYIGNGLYTLAGIALTVAGARELPRGLVVLGALAWAAGLALSASTLAGWGAGQFGTTAALMPLFVAWAYLVGRWLRAS